MPTIKIKNPDGSWKYINEPSSNADTLDGKHADEFALKTDIVNSDWNAQQGEPGHVLNRTHYEETVVNEVEYFAEQVLTFTTNGSGKNLITVTNPSGENLVLGDKYIVIFDGERYECVAKEPGYNIGNLALVSDTYENTGEPFRVGGMNLGQKLQFFAETPGDHTIAIYKVSEETVVHKLPEKYLPDIAKPYVIDLTGSEELNLDSDSIITTISYDEFAQHWWDGGILTIKFAVDEMPVTVYPSVVNVMPGQWFAFSFFSTISKGVVSVAFTNGTWTPPTT